ncbi:hypothetical protein DFH08DRAFT_982971 [Mycena albidolilacea]|uniref:FAD-binding domain-containing protein n=1 Tax=Mycena albidolilacea TaxID=1033008 RepID=A0AAD7AVC0_9AGAR|nr:hypothetical protein DFH08DRAFT_982971 [Mycena albidolilacea]
MSLNPQEASLKIKFVIIGGGIAGLACSFALRNSGHEVVVVEKHDGEEKTEGCVRSPPNMTRIMAKWPGMPSFLQTHATRCTGLSFRSSRTSEPVGFMKFHERIMDELQAEFLVIQHDDLRRQLHSLCMDAGVAFKRGKAVEIVKSSNGVDITLEGGEILHGTMVVGADGHNSFVRSLVMDGEIEPEHIVSGQVVNISIPTDVIQQHEDLRSLCKDNEFTIWMGADSSITGTLDAKMKMFNLSICSPSPSHSIDGDMYENHDFSYLRPFDLSGYDPRLQKLIRLGHGCRPTVHKVFAQEDILGLNGSIVLVGDAAHSILIHGSHNSSMAVEDAVTLGRLFSHLSHLKQIPVLTETYEELRQSRTNAARVSEYQALVQISLPPGTLQEDRDAALRLTLDQMFEDFENCESSDLLVEAWEQYLILFSHDAVEAVDNWWSKWSFTIKA